MRALFFNRPPPPLTPQFIRFERNIEGAPKLMYPVNGIRSQPAFSKPGIDSDTFSHNLRVGDKLVLFCNGWEVIRGMRDVGRMPGVNGSNGLMG